MPDGGGLSVVLRLANNLIHQTAIVIHQTHVTMQEKVQRPQVDDTTKKYIHPCFGTTSKHHY